MPRLLLILFAVLFAIQESDLDAQSSYIPSMRWSYDSVPDRDIRYGWDYGREYVRSPYGCDLYVFDCLPCPSSLSTTNDPVTKQEPIQPADPMKPASGVDSLPHETESISVRPLREEVKSFRVPTPLDNSAPPPVENQNSNSLLRKAKATDSGSKSSILRTLRRENSKLPVAETRPTLTQKPDQKQELVSRTEKKSDQVSDTGSKQPELQKPTSMPNVNSNLQTRDFQPTVRQSSIVNEISKSGLTIYDGLRDHPELYVSTAELENLLNEKLIGLNLDFKIRTRSKVVRQAICKTLGYPVPEGFKKTQPRFPGQDLDCYVQKSDNLQIWNEEIDATRRYAIVKLDDASIVEKVRVVSGDDLASLETTSTKTTKFQAKAAEEYFRSTLLSKSDTPAFRQVLNQSDHLMPIDTLFNKLTLLSGKVFSYEGNDQERVRAEALHKLVCGRLGCEFSEDGQFPDITDQLLEIKLQTSPTIDLGSTSPDSQARLEAFPTLKHRDARYAVFYGTASGKTVKLTRIVMVTGADFFRYFDRLEGKVQNSKLQIKLPASFFE